MSAAPVAPWDGRTVGELFVEQAARTPTAEAVVSRYRRHTYAELADDVDRVAGFLVERGVGRESHVAVLLPRSYHLVVGMLGALRAGGVYVPLNPALPHARLRTLVEDTRPVVTLSDGSLADRMPGSVGGPRVDLAQLLASGDVAGIGAGPDRHAPHSASYVIQTSGSTGRPKSVEVGMRALVNLLSWCRDSCGIEAGSRVLQVIASSFDASIRSYLTPLLVGATLVLSDEGPYDPEALLEWLHREQISAFNPAVPSMFYPVVQLAAADGYRALRSLRCLALGAEPPDLGVLGPWLASEHCRARVLNVYGPTEAADIACYAELATGTEPQVVRA